MSNTFCVIVTEAIDDTQQRQVQAAVEADAISWWHQMKDVWIVESEHNAGEWSRSLGVIFPYKPAKLLILDLAEYSNAKRYGARLPKGQGDWLAEHLGTEKPEVDQTS